MLSFCLKWKKVAEIINPKVLKTSNGKQYFYHLVCNSKRIKIN